MPHARDTLRSSLTRRDLLSLAARGAAGVVVSPSLLAYSPDHRTVPRSDAGADAHAAAETADLMRRNPCVLTAALTEGPYFVEEHLHRSDIRSDPRTGTLVTGVPLSLRFNVARLAGTACTPLTGAYLDVWHADPLGEYSDIAPGRGGPPPDPPPDGRAGPPPGERGGPPPGPPPGGDGQPRTNTAGRQFLRGYQITDARGVAQFQTVYPGWYPGRAVHIHFKLRLFAGATTRYEFTSQFFFDDALTDTVHSRAPYQTRGPRDMRNGRDGIYTSLSAAERDGLTLQGSPGAGGYAGVIALGVRVG